MASKTIAKRSAKAKVVSKKATSNKLLRVASDVWLEIGPIWMERNPKDIREVIIQERHMRRVKQG